MDIVTIDAQVSEDRRLIYTLPPEVPVGRVKLVIQSVEEKDQPPIDPQPLTREEARRRLLAAGKLATTPVAPEGAVALSDEERQRLAALFGSGPLRADEIIDQDRGPKE